MSQVKIPVTLEHTVTGAAEQRNVVELDRHAKVVFVDWGTAGLIEFKLKDGKPRQRKLPWRISAADCESMSRLCAGLEGNRR